MIVFQSSATAIVPQGQVTIAQCFSTGTRRRKHISPGGTAETLSRLTALIWPSTSAAGIRVNSRNSRIKFFPRKNPFFAKRTQFPMQASINQKDMRNSNLPIKANQVYSNLVKPGTLPGGILCRTRASLGVVRVTPICTH
jgi:hypothetical protein